MEEVLSFALLSKTILFDMSRADIANQLYWKGCAKHTEIGFSWNESQKSSLYEMC